MPEARDHEPADHHRRISTLERQVKRLEQQLREVRRQLQTHRHPHMHPR